MKQTYIKCNPATVGGGWMKCPYCDQIAKWCENKEIYGRNYGKSYMCYYCKPCNAYVGCHNNTKKPLGTMANAELREWRKQAHSVIDPIWKSGEKTRKQVYSELKMMFGKEIHIGESDINTCKAIIVKLTPPQSGEEGRNAK